MRDARPTLIVACSIPFSLLCAVTLMYFSGVTLNLISLSGLALGVGMLVDNSIVVIENIYRLRSEGVPAARAAVLGANQVAGAISPLRSPPSACSCPLCSQGLSRELFTDMGLTIAYSPAGLAGRGVDAGACHGRHRLAQRKAEGIALV